MIHVEPKELPVATVQAYLLGGVGPRPIALVSTVSADGIVNLAPFSFYNAFGANPPTVAFSASRRVRDNTLKDTYTNLVATKECVIQAVTHPIAQQVSLASTEYAAEVDEFIKSGLTPIPSDLVAPPRVEESPFQMECRLQQMISLGEGPGSGNLAICEVVKFHIAEDVFEEGIIQPDKIDLVARMSGNYYCRAVGESVFSIRKPVGRLGIGYDQLPEFVRHSKIFTANNLAQFGNCETIPSPQDVATAAGAIKPMSGDESAFAACDDAGDYRNMFALGLGRRAIDNNHARKFMILAAKRALDFDDTDFAWTATLYAEQIEE